MGFMFNLATDLIKTLVGWDTSNVTDMYVCFHDAEHLIKTLEMGYFKCD